MSIDGRAAAPISTSAAPQITPAIAANGVDFFVTWVEGNEVKVSRVDATGHASPPAIAGASRQVVIRFC
ncbi:MAG TPA: hypothetical protein VNN25_16665 [Thermoanaerobaculia bacterium]|nr:hypothetical protein [Thermoanaerobaculia bacterium]